MPLDPLEDIYVRLRRLERRLDEAGRVGVPGLYHATLATTGATPTPIYSFGTASGYTYQLFVRVVARRTGGSAGTAGDSASYIRKVSFRNVSGAVTILSGAVNVATDHEDQAGWDVTFDVSGTSVRCLCTGATNNNVNWDMQATIVQVA